jgi:predicted dinucleotide-binding enzyme
MNYFSLLLGDKNSSSDEIAESLEKGKFVNGLRNMLFKILAQKYKVVLNQCGLFISGEILTAFPEKQSVARATCH